jgi:hypothetical protein
MDVEPHIVERLLNHTMGSIGNKADSVVSAVAEVYNLAKYLPGMRNSDRDQVGAVPSKTDPRRLGAGFALQGVTAAGVGILVTSRRLRTDRLQRVAGGQSLNRVVRSAYVV